MSSYKYPQYANREINHFILKNRQKQTNKQRIKTNFTYHMWKVSSGIVILKEKEDGKYAIREWMILFQKFFFSYRLFIYGKIKKECSWKHFEAEGRSFLPLVSITKLVTSIFKGKLSLMLVIKANSFLNLSLTTFLYLADLCVHAQSVWLFLTP